MTFLKDEFKEMTSQDEREFFDENCRKIIMNAKFYLEHLDDGTFWTYRVSFEDYDKSRDLADRSL